MNKVLIILAVAVILVLLFFGARKILKSNKQVTGTTSSNLNEQEASALVESELEEATQNITLEDIEQALVE